MPAAIELRRLGEVDPAALVALMNDPRVRRHMPLARGAFGAAECARFVAAKERLWAEHGYGPWAFVVDGALAGWGGVQPDGGEADLALVLHPDHWGIGPALQAGLLAHAFDTLGVPSVVALLPPTRTRVAALRRAGFVEDGAATVGGERFVRFRLTADAWRGRSAARRAAADRSAARG